METKITRRAVLNFGRAVGGLAVGGSILGQAPRLVSVAKRVKMRVIAGFQGPTTRSYNRKLLIL
jgi:hypothetical protein